MLHRAAAGAHMAACLPACLCRRLGSTLRPEAQRRHVVLTRTQAGPRWPAGEQAAAHALFTQEPVPAYQLRAGLCSRFMRASALLEADPAQGCCPSGSRVRRQQLNACMLCLAHSLCSTGAGRAGSSRASEAELPGHGSAGCSAEAAKRLALGARAHHGAATHVRCVVCMRGGACRSCSRDPDPGDLVVCRGGAAMAAWLVTARSPGCAPHRTVAQ
jgi:hypothetical protein